MRRTHVAAKRLRDVDEPLCPSHRGSESDLEIVFVNRTLPRWEGLKGHADVLAFLAAAMNRRSSPSRVAHTHPHDSHDQ